jgi:hypothetical protein
MFHHEIQRVQHYAQLWSFHPETSLQVIGKFIFLFRSFLKLEYLFFNQVHLQIGHGKELKGPFNVFLNLAENDGCELVKGVLTNPMLRWFLEKAGTTLLRHIHSCPYSVSYQF